MLKIVLIMIFLTGCTTITNGSYIRRCISDCGGEINIREMGASNITGRYCCRCATGNKYEYGKEIRVDYKGKSGY